VLVILLAIGGWVSKRRALLQEKKRKGKKYTHKMMVQNKARQRFKLDLPRFERFLKCLQNKATCHLKLARIKEERSLKIKDLNSITHMHMQACIHT
jgi:hypothetical protein